MQIIIAWLQWCIARFGQAIAPSKSFCDGILQQMAKSVGICDRREVGRMPWMEKFRIFYNAM